MNQQDQMVADHANNLAAIRARDAAVKAEKTRRCAVLKANHGPNAGRTLGDYCECSRCNMGPIHLFGAAWSPAGVST